MAAFYRYFSHKIFMFYFFFTFNTNYKHFAAEQINHGISWIITQIHAKSFRAKWWSGKHLTLLFLSLRANSALPPSFSHSVCFVTFSNLLSSATTPSFVLLFCLQLSSVCVFLWLADGFLFAIPPCWCSHSPSVTQPQCPSMFLPAYIKERWKISLFPR